MIQKMKKLEKIGLGLMLIGLIIMVVESIIKSDLIHQIAEIDDILVWLGLGVWAWGYSQRGSKEKD